VRFDTAVVRRTSLICALIAGVLALLTGLAAPRHLSGVLAGAALGIIDLWLIALVVRFAFSGPLGWRRVVLLGACTVGKIAMVVFAFYYFLVHVRMSALGLLLGLTALPIGIGIMPLGLGWKRN
jgi:hypothetical protein